MGTIDYTKLISEAYDNIFNVLDTRTYISDPRSPSNIKNRTFIHNSDPEELALDFNDFPYIYAEFPTLTKTNYTNDGKVAEVSWTQRFIVRCARDGSSNSARNIGKLDFLSMCDDLHQTFDSLTVRQTLSDQNIRKVRINQVTSTTNSINNITVYESEFELTYTTRITVSA